MNGAATTADKYQPVLQYARCFGDRALAGQQFLKMLCLRGVAEPKLSGFIAAFAEVDTLALAPDQHFAEALGALLRYPHRPLAKFGLCPRGLCAGGGQCAHSEQDRDAAGKTQPFREGHW